MIIDKCIERVKNNQDIDFAMALELATSTQADELFEAADHLRRYLHGNGFDLCSIVNAKAGRCSEDCTFCAQSAHYDTEIESSEIIDEDAALLQALENDRHRVNRLSLVTAGRSASLEDMREYGRIYEALAEKTALQLCASMGMLTREKAEMLKSFGVRRYHCNLETCRSYFPRICSTHSWEEKVDTIRIAQQAGMDVCSGGIIGLGESLEHRIELALELRELGILSIPINVFSPIAQTPLARLQPLPLSEILTCIAVFRFINPHAVVRLAGGRAQLGDNQYRCFSSGANGAIVGNYLTTRGNSMAADLRNIEQMGFVYNNGGGE